MWRPQGDETAVRKHTPKTPASALVSWSPRKKLGIDLRIDVDGEIGVIQDPEIMMTLPDYLLINSIPLWRLVLPCWGAATEVSFGLPGGGDTRTPGGEPTNWL